MRNMEIEIVPVEKFEVKIGEKVVGEFEKISSWEGFAKLQGKNGTIIVKDERDFLKSILTDIFGSEKQSSFTVVEISPSLIPTE